jgi:hypothetical protein
MFRTIPGAKVHNELTEFGAFNLLFAAGDGDVEKIERIKLMPIEKVMYVLNRRKAEERAQARELRSKTKR